MKEEQVLEIKTEDLSIEVQDLLSEEISELISDKTGFCHVGFSITIIVDATLDISE